MPAGGTWIAQNKVRPGAYINFVSVPKPIGSLGSRGVVAVAMPMSWGPANTLIKLTGAELLNGASLAKVGVTAFDQEASLPFRAALAGCYTALLFRTDNGGAKATAVIDKGVLTASAKYTGTLGNKISVVTVADEPDEGDFTVNILVNGTVQESFVGKQAQDAVGFESKFVDFNLVGEGTTPLKPTAGIALTSGTNGTISSALYPEFFKSLATKNFQCVAIYEEDDKGMDGLIAQVALWRTQRGKKVQAVVHNKPTADSEGVISVDQGFKTDSETIDEHLFPVWFASMTAGAEVNESLTAQVINGAVEIINPVEEDDIVGALVKGRTILSYRQDGAVCVEKDINTLQTFTPDKGYAFSKNRVIRCLDEIGNTAALVFNRNYCGKVDNDAIGRNQYKTELISQMDTLMGIHAITNFDGAKDVTVLPGESVDSVVVDLTIQPVDSMEKLYMTVNVNA